MTVSIFVHGNLEATKWRQKAPTFDYKSTESVAEKLT